MTRSTPHVPAATALWLLAALLLVSVAPAEEGVYTVGPGDVLDVRVFGEAELTRSVEVAQDGTIGFPLLGRVRVAGVTARGVEELLRAALAKDYLVDPHVTVTVTEYHSRKVYVLGAVKSPGFYELKGATTLLEIISRAGGILPEGGKSIVVVRGVAAAVDESEPEKAREGEPDSTLLIDGYKLFQEGDTSQNVYLSNLDVVYVPKAREVFVIGEVKKPGPVTYAENLTLVQALGQAGGATELAALRRVQLIRVEGGKKINMRYNLNDILQNSTQDVPLRPDDVIVVPKRVL